MIGQLTQLGKLIQSDFHFLSKKIGGRLMKKKLVLGGFNPHWVENTIKPKLILGETLINQLNKYSNSLLDEEEKIYYTYL